MTSATISVFESAIGLATQAVHQDKAKNYTEAARCYKESIATFEIVKSKSGNSTVSKAIDEKIKQYRERVKRIDKYLLGKQDLSQLFKAVVNSEQSETNEENGEIEFETKVVSVDDDISIEGLLLRGTDAIEKAKRKDAKHNYKDALKLYDEGMTDLLQVAVDTQDAFPQDADVVKYKCLLIHERINAIKNHIETGAPLSDRKDSNLETIKDENRGYKSRNHSGNSNGFDSCSASPEPLMNITSISNYGNATTTIAEEYEDEEDEDHLLLMEEIRSNLSLASISAATSTTFNPVCYVPLPPPTELDTFQKAASEAGSRHSLYPMCEIKRSPSLISGQSDIDMLQGKFLLGEKQKQENVIPLADLDKELCISSYSLKDSAVGDGTERSDGIKSTSMLSSASSYNSLSKHKYQSFHSSAEDVLAAYAICSTPESAKNYTFTENDRNVSELTYVNTEFIDPIAYKELCLNDSEGSDSGISSGQSPKNSARDPSLSSTPTMNTANEEDLKGDQEEVISRTLSDNSLCAKENEAAPLLAVASVYQEQNMSGSNLSVKVEEAKVEKQSKPDTPNNISTTSINATGSMEKLSSRQASKNSLDNDDVKSVKFLTPSPPLSRGGSKSSRASNVSRAEEDELMVLSAEEIVEVDSAPLTRSKSPKAELHELQMQELEAYGDPSREYIPPRAFARRPNETEDEEGINKGCYYFMSCLDAFWIL